jgi:hypothetical protein
MRLCQGVFAMQMVILHDLQNGRVPNNIYFEILARYARLLRCEPATSRVITNPDKINFNE